jgi:ATP-binding protein involved in chromosome partitioning
MRESIIDTMAGEEQVQHQHVHQHQHADQPQGNLPPGMHPSFMRVIQQKQRVKQKLSGIKHKIGVYSAKGGVGKTTVAINIAYSLMKQGFKVGLLDADIDCPNVTMFLGIEERMEPVMPLKPILKDGVKVASTAMLVDELKRPIIWRGPIVVKMLGDFFENTDWGELDYLIIDLPPGTSDAPLTIMQVLDLDGFVIVTNPQKIAGTNSIRSGLMAKRLGVAVLGVVENMANGKPSEKTIEVVKTLDTEFLGSVQREKEFAEMTDNGKIHVMENKEIENTFNSITAKILGK